MARHKFSPDCVACVRDKRRRKVVRVAAKIIMPGAWWVGKPPNAFQKKRVALAMKKARAVFSIFSSTN